MVSSYLIKFLLCIMVTSKKEFSVFMYIRSLAWLKVTVLKLNTAMKFFSDCMIVKMYGLDQGNRLRLLRTLRCIQQA